MSATPIKKDNKTVGINMNKSMAEELSNRAESIHLSVSKYCKIILQQWLDSDNQLNLTEK